MVTTLAQRNRLWMKCVELDFLNAEVLNLQLITFRHLGQRGCILVFLLPARGRMQPDPSQKRTN